MLNLAQIKDGQGRAIALASGRTVLLHTFTGPDSDVAIPAADTGQATEALASSVWGIGTNRAKYVSGGTDNNRFVVWDAGVPNGSVEVTFAVLDGGGFMRLAFRCSDVNNLFIVDRFDGYTLYRREAGTFTAIGNDATAAEAGDVLRVRLTGSSIALDVNDEERITATDSFNVSATKVGLGLFQSDTTARWENLRVTA